MYSVIRQLWPNLAIHTQLCHDKVVHSERIKERQRWSRHVCTYRSEDVVPPRGHLVQILIFTEKDAISALLI